ncbi:MAG TPA: MFS transporter [Stellaceae bacterium]|nr:MFS transporter [Stellaceae bacterium]
MSSGAANVDVAELVANAKLGRQHIAILLLSALMLFIDGFDMSTAGVAAPSLLKAFHGEKAAMGTIFGASYAGILVGCWIFGYVGDRWGRKAGAIWSCIVYGVPSLLITQATSLDQILYLRFLVGIGLGGVMPTTLALLAESAPKNYRASFAMLALFGFPLGGSMVGQVGAHLIPAYGWPVVFYVAGIGGLALSAALIFVLPESLQFLALHKPDSVALRRRAQRFAPDRSFGPETRFTVQREEKPKGLAVFELFKGKQRLATILLWTAYFVEGLTYITLANWMAVVLQDVGLSSYDALTTVSYANAGGILVAICLMRPLDKIGPMASVVSAIVAIAAIITLGTPGVPQLAIMAAAIVAHSFCSGTHTSLNGTVALFYPTRMRSNGIGWASALGRVSSIIGPIIVGNLFSAHVPLQWVLYGLTLPYVVLIGTSIFLGRLYVKSYSQPEASGTATLTPAPAAE